MTTKALFNKDNERRGVAPIIATLLMVAIAVVGGILIFVFAQGFFSSTSVEGPIIESVTLLGYDTRDAAVSSLLDHAGTGILNAGSATIGNNRIAEADDIVLYFKNTGTQDLVLNTFEVAGVEYSIDTAATAIASAQITEGSYGILDGILNATSTTPVLTAGKETTIVVSVDESPLKTGRTYSASITTGNGATFKFDFIAGIQKG